VLRPSDPNKPLKLFCDANAVSVTGLLMQYDEHAENYYIRPIACTSKKLLPTEKNYSTIECEVYAVVFSVSNQPHLRDHKYVINKQRIVLIIDELTFFSNRIVDLWNNLPSRTTRVARFSTTKYGKFLSVDPSKSSPPNVSIYNSVHVAIRTQIPHKQ